MPADVKSNVLSPDGISESEGVITHPLFSKKLRNSDLTLDDNLFIMT
jgi:hypothetical protein